MNAQYSTKHAVSTRDTVFSQCGRCCALNIVNENNCMRWSWRIDKIIDLIITHERTNEWWFYHLFGQACKKSVFLLLLLVVFIKFIPSHQCIFSILYWTNLLIWMGSVADVLFIFFFSRVIRFNFLISQFVICIPLCIIIKLNARITIFHYGNFENFGFGYKTQAAQTQSKNSFNCLLVIEVKLTENNQSLWIFSSLLWKENCVYWL